MHPFSFTYYVFLSQVFLNGRSVKDVDSPYSTTTSISISRTQLTELHTVSVQTLGAGNVNSSLTHCTVNAAIEIGSRNSPFSLSPIPDKNQAVKKRLVSFATDFSLMMIISLFTILQTLDENLWLSQSRPMLIYFCICFYSSWRTMTTIQ